MRTARQAAWAILCGVVVAAGCGDGPAGKAPPAAADAEQRIREKWGKALDDLPLTPLTVISPHNRNIETEIGRAFCIEYALAHGKCVDIEWRDIGGGSSSILRYLRNVYERSDSAGIDVVWGGGEVNFQKLAAENILQPVTMQPDVVASIPQTFGGLEMYDAKRRWVGAALSGFGFLYNATRLKRLKIAPPTSWDDLADRRFHGQIALADPMKSGSANASYEMIVQSGKDWPTGWAKLLGVLGNASRFYDGASRAADAVISEAPVTTCIDFYGALRVAKYPKHLVYVSPKGQTAFSPDPIGILKNPPHGELAQAFVDFVLSRRGQAMLALPPGQADGPAEHVLGRQPIRKDVYEVYAGKFVGWIINPYAAGNEMKLDVAMRRVRFGVLRDLVQVAAVENVDGLRAARKKLIDAGLPPEKTKQFNELPPNLRTREDVAAMAEKLRDKTEAERILTDWRAFFRRKYARLAG